jgi:hypothetical protein
MQLRDIIRDRAHARTTREKTMSNEWPAGKKNAVGLSGIAGGALGGIIWGAAAGPLGFAWGAKLGALAGGGLGALAGGEIGRNLWDWRHRDHA